MTFLNQIFAQSSDLFACRTMAMGRSAKTDDFHIARHHTQIAYCHKIAYIILDAMTLTCTARCPALFKNHTMFFHFLLEIFFFFIKYRDRTVSTVRHFKC
jgi:hypothetical protein